MLPECIDLAAPELIDVSDRLQAAATARAVIKRSVMDSRSETV
jgi:hypothetical protein